MSTAKRQPIIHTTADVSPSADIGLGTSIWNWAQVRENTKIGTDCVISKGVYIDTGVTVGNSCKIQNNASLFHGVTLQDNIFVGPHVCFTNDYLPRAVNPDASAKTADDWDIAPIHVESGVAIGANSTIVCGTTLGAWSMVAAGSVVTRDVAEYTLVQGNPARVQGRVCRCGTIHRNVDQLPGVCLKCGFQHKGEPQ